MAKENEVKRYRDAESGRYVTREYAEKNPKTTRIVKRSPGREGGPGIKKEKK